LTRSGRFNVLIPDTIVNKINSQHWKEQNREAIVIGSILNVFHNKISTVSLDATTTVINTYIKSYLTLVKGRYFF
jgi:hypothetical protein